MADEADREQRGWRLLRGLPPESDRRAVVVTLMVCIACSAAIATAVTFLGPLRDANRAAEREAKLRHMIASVPGLEELVEPDGGIRIEARVVDLATGEPLPDIGEEGRALRRHTCLLIDFPCHRQGFFTGLLGDFKART